MIGIVAFYASLAIANWPLLTATTARFPGDLGDTRFIHYLLEHSWRWVSRDPNHRLWSPPFYYPVENTGAFSDIMVSLGVLYWPWRLIGMGPMAALSLWIVTCHALNFISAWLILRRLLGFSPHATAAGATLFTLGSPRLNQLNHLQFLPQFFVLMSLAGNIMLFQQSRTEHRRRIAVGMACGGIVLQFHSAFYYGWFVVLIHMLRRHIKPLMFGAGVSIVVMIPWAHHYLEAARLNPSQTFDDIRGWVPRYQSWFYMGRSNWLYSWAMEQTRFSAIPGWSNHEHRLGIGFITLLLAGSGLLIRIRDKWVVLTVLVSTTLLVASTRLVGEFVIWQFVCGWVPGASAVRTVTRIALMLLIPASFGVACSIEWLVRHRQTAIPLALIGLIMLEQGNDYPTWRQQLAQESAELVASGIPDGCRSFYFSPAANGPNTPDYSSWMYQIDAMWAGLYANVPTVNAYGHNVPPGWDLGDPAIRTPNDAVQVKTALAAWESLHPNAAPICHVVIPVP